MCHEPRRRNTTTVNNNATIQDVYNLYKQGADKANMAVSLGFFSPVADKMEIPKPGKKYKNATGTTVEVVDDPNFLKPFKDNTSNVIITATGATNQN